VTSFCVPSRSKTNTYLSNFSSYSFFRQNLSCIDKRWWTIFAVCNLWFSSVKRRRIEFTRRILVNWSFSRSYYWSING
jgi:sarcosine oxidase delta subunit